MHTSPLNTDLSEYICHTCVLNASLVNSTFNMWNAFMTTFQKCFSMQKIIPFYPVSLNTASVIG